MKLNRLTLTGLAVVSTTFLVAMSLPQDDGESVREAGMDELQDQLPAELDMLEKHVGTWSVRGDFSAMGGKLAGTWTSAMGLGGMWLVGDLDSEYTIEGNTIPFHGHGVTGWDIVEEKYVSTWFDSMTPHVSISHGEFEEATHTMTWFGNNYDPSTGEKTRVKMVETMPNDDTITLTMFDMGEDRSETKTATLVYTRQ